ncbi:MAG TPA: FHA domain-containing serine/threonine-protein kinase [Planctomycetota bacterium]|nr:FHA domain-containing serine/threonine-protein kinase [Planctomycetota bacterium]
MPELRVDSGPQKGQTFLLAPPGPFSFGRDLAADFPLFDRRVSREHFRIDFRDLGYSITDLGSKAGTSLNGVAVHEATLTNGDRILAGTTELSFRFDAPEDPLAGRELGGYRIIERVGRGGMGTVYRALQLSLDRIVAIKVLSDELARDGDFSALFVEEAHAAGELSNPNIVRVYDVDRIDGVLFYVMEFMARGSVEGLLRREGSLPAGRAIEIAIEAASGLVYAEEAGLVHRDIKPANLMIHEGGAVKIGDLGIATRSRSRGGTGRTSGISGSPHYMAPEQVLGREVDGRADIYALGASLYQMLTGFPPFKGQSVKEILYAHIREDPPDPREARSGLAEGLSLLVRRMLSKDPAGRPASALELRRELEEAGAREARRPRNPRPRIRFRWPPAATLLLLSITLAVCGIVAGVFYGDLGRAMTARRERIERIERILSEGSEAIGEGDLEKARVLLEEIRKTEGYRDEWQLLQARIDAFENALKRAAAQKDPGGGE